MLLYSFPAVFLAAMNGVSAAPLSEAETSYGHSPSYRASTLADCLGNASVPVSLLSSPDFAELAQPFNLRLPYTPAVIVLPTTARHVSDAVRCACKFGVKVQAKSGGHSYASYSSGGKNGSLIVDLEPLQNISVDNKTGIATVGGGVRLGNLALGIFNQAKRGLPHGTCPGVGIGGHFTHGGYGHDSRMWGLALDTIVGLDVVLANGSFIHATSTAYPEIYYALRGAADAFGIIINFYLQTQPAPSTVINWSFGIPGMFVSAETSTNAFLHIQDFARNASVIDRKISFGSYLDGQGYSIGGTYFGTLDNFNNKIAPELIRGLPTPTSTSVQEVGWIESLTLLAGEPLQQPLTNYNEHSNFFAKSITSPESAPLTAEALTSYFNYIIKNGVNPPSPWFSIINLYGGPDSQINTKDINFAAYSDRNALWVFQHYGYADGSAIPFPSGTTPFIDGLNSALTSAQPQTAFGAYLNYVDPSLSPQTAHELYYGAELYSRLLAIKKEVDPFDVFWNPQAVGTQV